MSPDRPVPSRQSPRGHGQHGHGHSHGPGPFGWLGAIFHLHGHGDDGVTGRDQALATRDGIRTIWAALAALGLTTALQVVIVLLSGSVALLADTVHNLGDFLNSIPLLVAFYVGRRAATARYTYGYGRAEDVAGIFIVASILFSAGYILWESIRKLIEPAPITHLPWVAAAALIGAVGNEAVAWFQIRIGRRIGSEAMIADGLHARIDGLTSLAVLIAVAGVALGVPIVDPIVGLVIGVSILFIARDATRRIWYRFMDAVDPRLTERLRDYAGEIPGVAGVPGVQARWLGHALHAELRLIAEPGRDGAAITRQVRDVLRRNVPGPTAVTIEVAGAGREADDGAGPVDGPSGADILPPRYRDPATPVSAAPMGAAGLQYDAAGEVAWDEMWGGFCELALAGGAPHRGILLEPVPAASPAADPERYAWVLDELGKGIRRVTGRPAVPSPVPGWIGVECDSEAMALWMLRAIVVENVTVRREGTTLWFPAGPEFRLDREIRNVITVIAKTNHYWEEHMAAAEGRPTA